jgi:4'-phosphopantetheinyl transferase
LTQWLDFAELQKAESFHFQTDRNRYIIACSAKRDILSRYLQCEPKDIRFTFGSHGKPHLREENNITGLNFNLAHSNEWALLAVTRQGAVGIDVELMRPNLTDVDVITQIFSSYERESIQSLPDELRVKAFFNCWTRKEAFVKATGLGLSYPLQHFDVSCMPKEAAKLLHIRDQPQTAGHWSMIDLDLGDVCYVASVVLEKTNVSLKQWNWG